MYSLKMSFSDTNPEKIIINDFSANVKEGQKIAIALQGRKNNDDQTAHALL